ncbi:MAG: hypothetical protein JNM94_14890 [Phycisphaerae bacterium]|nr:hypothetical protein [Phycisphaerae bacterium]
MVSKTHRRAAYAVAFSFALNVAAFAGDTTVLLDPSPNPKGALGSAIVLTPEWILVGAPGKRLTFGASTVSSGAILRWARDASGAPVGAPTIIPPSGQKAGERFGLAFDAGATTLVVGSPGYTAVAPSFAVGRVRVLSLGTGAVLNSLAPPSAGPGSPQYGAAVATDDLTIVAGAPDRVLANLITGSVYVLNKNGPSWSVPANGILSAPVTAPYVGFGSAVGLTDAEVLVGAPGGISLPQAQHGRVYIYDRDALGTPTTTLLAPTPTLGDRFGTAIATEGTLLAVGAPGNDCDDGVVHLYRKRGDSYTFEATLTAPDSLGWTGFGSDVAIDRERVAVGSGGIKTEWELGFRAAVFRKAGDSWTLEATAAGNEAPAAGAVALDAAGLAFSDPLDRGGAVRYVALPRLPDLDFDGVVGPTDLGLLLGAWGTNTVWADLDASGEVGAADLGVLLGAWSD